MRRARPDVLQTVGALAGAGAHGARRHGGAGGRRTRSRRRTSKRCASTRRGRSCSRPASSPRRFPRIIEATKLDPDFGRGYLERRDRGAATSAGAKRPTSITRRRSRKIDRMTEREKFRTRGQYYLFSRNAPKAIEEFTALVEKYPSDAAGLEQPRASRIRSCASSTRRWRSARASRRCIPKNPLRQNNVALYAMYAGKFEDAIAGGKKATELNKDYALAYVSQALGCRGARQIRRCRRGLQAAGGDSRMARRARRSAWRTWRCCAAASPKPRRRSSRC